MKAATFAASLIPLPASTPLETSTAHGRTARTAAPTFSGVSPPERISGSGSCRGTSDQSNSLPVPP